MNRKTAAALLISLLLLFNTSIVSMAKDNAVHVADDFVYSVVVPQNIGFVIDPYELAGRGSVYSEPAEFINYGDTDVILTISDVSAVFANDYDFMCVPYRFGEELVTDKKAIHLSLQIEAFGYPPAVITAGDTSEVAVKLSAYGEEGSFCSLSVWGSVNPYPAEKWREGDVVLLLTYTISPVLSKEDTSELDGESPAVFGDEVVSGAALSITDTDSRNTVVNDEPESLDAQTLNGEEGEQHNEQESESEIDTDYGGQSAEQPADGGEEWTYD